jgi:hypothetical protein
MQYQANHGKCHLHLLDNIASNESQADEYQWMSECHPLRLPWGSRKITLSKDAILMNDAVKADAYGWIISVNSAMP